MRKMIILSLALVFTTVAFAQPAAPKNQLTERDYILKSKQQKTAAWVLVGGGSELSADGLLTVTVETINKVNGSVADASESMNSYIKKSHGGNQSFIRGLIDKVSSIPFFIKTSNYKRSSAGIYLSMKIESRPILQQAAVTKIKYPALAVKFNL